MVDHPWIAAECALAILSWVVLALRPSLRRFLVRILCFLGETASEETEGDVLLPVQARENPPKNPLVEVKFNINVSTGGLESENNRRDRQSTTLEIEDGGIISSVL
ncbi:hypothetical protein KSP40_PGU010299 [Platanthera guangdongensis]|uniref:Uncharacterized protein n=1 Tax=Platanthera guangdongensis TaxID=2320717 RepID=A0ABR2MUQ5_9ASPA